MLSFTEYLTEAASTEETTKKQTHLEHPEDLSFDSHDGVATADSHLRGLSDYLLGKKRGAPSMVSKKVDGAPAVHFTKDNEGRIGVATKSMFNKTPKINYTPEDIERNHADSPGLVKILKAALEHGPKILPKDMKPGEIYKGDVLFGGDRPASKKGKDVSFQPNLLRYSVPSSSPEGAKIKNAKFGIAMHTKFNPDGSATALTPKDKAKFQDHPDVYNMSTDVESNPSNYTPNEQREFEDNMEKARRAYSQVEPDTYDKLAGHQVTLRTHVNDMVRKGGEPSFQGYMDFLTKKHQKDVDSVKTQAAKDRKIKAHSDAIQNITQNQKQLEKVIDLHKHLRAAKKVLLGVMAKNSKEKVELPNGEATTHEGYVTTMPDGSVVKHVDRDEFSKHNLGGAGAISQSKETK